MLFVFIKAVFGGGHKLGNVDRMVVTHVSVDDPTVGISHRGTFPSPWHIRYSVEPDTPLTETAREPPDHSLLSLTGMVRVVLPLP